MAILYICVANRLQILRRIRNLNQKKRHGNHIFLFGHETGEEGRHISGEVVREP